MIGLDTTILVQLEIVELPNHTRIRQALRREIQASGQEIALAPQIIAEFIHVVTDGGRFERPLGMQEALARAAQWWDASEVRHVYPTQEVTRLFLEWMIQHQLGRKRILDTFWAATLWCAGVRRLMTSNPRDFHVFGRFEIVVP